MAANPIDMAEAEAEAKNVKVYKRKGTGESAESAGLPNDLVDLEPNVQPDRHDPSHVSILYHSFDGRQVVVPAFMVPKLFAERLPNDSGTPTELRGTRVWYAEPRPEYGDKPKLLCLFHAGQPDAIKEELQAAGARNSICTKSNLPSEYQVNLHAEHKHPRDYKLLIEYRADSERRADREVQAQTAQAMLKMLEAMTTSKE